MTILKIPHGGPGRAGWLVAMTLVCPSACADQAGDNTGVGSSYSVRDSSGVEIVESTAPRFSDSLAWSLSPEPVVQLGTPEGNSVQSFFRITAMTRLSDGRVALINDGTRDVRVVDPSTGSGAVWGVRGEGPGEFTFPQTLQVLPNDSLLAFDWANRRVTVFGSQGALAYTLPLSPDTTLSGFRHVTRRRDGSHVILDGASIQRVAEGDGIYREPQWTIALDPTGRHLREIFHFEGSEGQRAAGSIGSAPFGRRGGVLATSDGFITYFSEWFGFTLRDSLGTPTRVARTDREARPITEEDKEQWRADSEAQWQRNSLPPDIREIMLASIRAAHFPPSRGVFDRILVDRADNVWIRAPRSVDAEGPNRWSVFDMAGVWVTDVLTPGDLEVFEFGEDYVLGRWRDEFDIEYVRIYSIEKPEG